MPRRVRRAIALPALTLTPRIEACTSTFQNDNVRAAIYEVGGDLRIGHAWDFRAVTLELGFAVGGSWLRQSFETRGVSRARRHR